jgi:uncharacterized protein YbjT (DUF2867 family)
MSGMTPRTALIAGATGLVGGHCLRLLLASDACQRVIALARRPLGISHPRLDERVIRFEDLETMDPFPAASEVYCALGTTIAAAGSQSEFRRVDFDYPRALAIRAAAAGARQFLLVSSVSADPGSPNFYLRVKGELEEAVSALRFDSVHIFRPSFLIGDRPRRRRAESLGAALFRAIQPALAGPLRKYRAIDAAVLASAMLAAARVARPGRHVYHYDQILSV